MCGCEQAVNGWLECCMTHLQDTFSTHICTDEDLILLSLYDDVGQLNVMNVLQM